MRLTGVKRLVLFLALCFLTTGLCACIRRGPADEPTGEATGTESSTQSDASETAAAGNEPASLPTVPSNLQLDDGLLEIVTAVGLDGLPNVDSDGRTMDGLLGLLLLNRSGRQLERLELSVTYIDGTVVPYMVSELPSGSVALALPKENIPSPADGYAGAAVDAVIWRDGAPAIPAGVTWTTDGKTVIVTNGTGADISGLTVYFRLQQDSYFYGGNAFTCTLDGIPAGGSVEFSAETASGMTGCYWGTPQIVRVDPNE